jgi:acyl-CoA synthetase (NDP forming)
MIRVNSMDGWADALLALSMVAPPASRNVFALTGGGGTSVLYGDNFIREGLSIPELGAQTMERLKEIVPVAGSIAGNPLDLWLVFNDVECLKSLLDLAETDPAVAAVVIDRLIARSAFHSPEMPDLTRDIVEMLEERKGEKPVIFVVDTEGGDPDLASQGAASRRALGRAGYAAFPTSRRAARALSRLCTYYEGQVCS